MSRTFGSRLANISASAALIFVALVTIFDARGFQHYLRLWDQSLLRDVAVAVMLLAVVGVVLSVGPFALELIGFC